MQFLECKFFTKMTLLVFIYTMIRWINALFPKLLRFIVKPNTHCHPGLRRTAQSALRALIRDPSTNTINSLQPLFNST